MIWLLALVDLAAGIYLLDWALRREQRDKPGVLAVGAVLLLCAVLLGGLGLRQVEQEEPAQLPPTDSVTAA